MSRPAWLAVAAAVGALVAVNLLVRTAERLTREPSGPQSSSYATAPHGLAAYAELLRRDGRRVVRLREAPSEAELRPAATVVLVDASRLAVRDARALDRFVRQGGRLVTGGERGTTGWLGRLFPDAVPRLTRGGPERVVPLAPVAEVAGVGVVRALGTASWRRSGPALPALGGRDGILLAVAEVGRGRVVLLADASPLHNRLLARADNAALGLGLAGDESRPVAFVESVHGFGEATGLAAVPVRWWWALGGLTLAALVFLLARGRRLGPPELPARPLPPPRRLYVESLAAVLARTERPADALAPVGAEVRRLLAGRVPDPEAEPARSAAALGLDEASLRAALAPRGPEDIVPAGRVLARAVRLGGRR